ncbi:MAG TPA: SoxR reducing system RseC family protein [Bacillota bacterium]|nr:SoxR reducing system RseC family protein [Bacillota bacterium]
MQQLGRVLSREQGWAVLEIVRPSACKGCGMCQPSANAKRVKAICDIDAGVGDYVTVEMKDGDVLKAAGIAYGVPLLGFLAGMVAGNGLSVYLGRQASSDLFSAVGGFVFLFLAYIGVRKYDLGLDKKSFCPVVTGLADPGADACSGRAITN